MPLFQNRKAKEPSANTSEAIASENPYGYQPHQPNRQGQYSSNMSSYNQHHELSARDQEIARLQAQVQSLTNQLESAKQQQAAERGGNTKRRPQMSPHAVHIRQVNVDPKGKRSVIQAGRERMGRKASISTQQVMASLPPTDNEHAHHPVAVRILQPGHGR